MFGFCVEDWVRIPELSEHSLCKESRSRAFEQILSRVVALSAAKLVHRNTCFRQLTITVRDLLPSHCSSRIVPVLKQIYKLLALG